MKPEIQVLLALEAEKTHDGLPIIRQCAWCKEWLDEASELVAKTKKAIEYTISHGLCDKCDKKMEDGDEKVWAGRKDWEE